MNGTIITFCKDVSAGVIQDSAGRKYLFNFNNWMSAPARPLPDTDVTFSPARAWATDIHVMLAPDVRKQALQLPVANAA